MHLVLVTHSLLLLLYCTFYYYQHHPCCVRLAHRWSEISSFHLFTTFVVSLLGELPLF